MLLNSGVFALSNFGFLVHFRCIFCLSRTQSGEIDLKLIRKPEKYEFLAGKTWD